MPFACQRKYRGGAADICASQDGGMGFLFDFGLDDED